MSIQTDDFGADFGDGAGKKPSARKSPATAEASVGARMVDASPETPQEEAIERALRPKLLDDYEIGRAHV